MAKQTSFSSRKFLGCKVEKNHFVGSDDPQNMFLVSLRNLTLPKTTALRLQYEILIRFLDLSQFQCTDAPDRIKTATLKILRMIPDVIWQQPQKFTVANSKFNNVQTDSNAKTTKKTAKVKPTQKTDVAQQTSAPNENQAQESRSILEQFLGSEKVKLTTTQFFVWLFPGLSAIKSPFTNTKLSFEILRDENKPVVTENFEIRYRDQAHQKRKFPIFPLIRILMQRLELTA